MAEKRKYFPIGVVLLLMLASCTTDSEENLLQSSDPTQAATITTVPLDRSAGDIQITPNQNLSQNEDGAGVLVPETGTEFVQNFGPNEISERDYSELEIVTLLPPDAIPALNFPNYYSVREANQEYMPDEIVIGVEFNGDARAYSVSLLSRHEIVNDTVGGIHIAVTW